MLRKAILGLFFLSLPILSAQQAKVDFKSQVWPILKRSCLECHRVPHNNKEGKLIKPKADLIIEHANGIMKGTRDGAVVIPGKPERSLFYTLLVLDDDDDDKMPSKGDPLTSAETKLISQWILEGAEFGDWDGAKDYTPGAFTKKIELEPLKEEVLANRIKSPTQELIKRARQSKALIQPLAINFPLMDVTFVSSPDNIFDRNFHHLMPLKNHIARLSASSTSLTSNSFKKLQAFPNLVRLNLKDTKVSDNDLQFISNIRHLEMLNLYGTKVSNAGIKHLAKLKNLKTLYLRGTKVTTPAVKQLQKSLPELKVHYGSLNYLKDYSSFKVNLKK